MASRPITKNVTTLARTFKDRLQDRAGITHWGKDSIARHLSSALTNETLRLQSETVSAFDQIQIGKATGRNLDMIAQTYGLSRIPPTYCTSSKMEQNFHFFSRSGTFGAINGGLSITIPKGTILSSDSVAGDQLQYVTVNDNVLPAARTYFYCTVRAQTAGPTQNVGEQVLDLHSFTSYVDSASSTLGCNNTYPILNGSTLEGDKSLRTRISGQWATLAGSTSDAILLKGIAIPGVNYVTPISNYFGIGTCAVFVFGSQFESNDQLATAVQQRLNEMQTPGLLLQALPGIRVYFDFVISIRTTAEFSGNQKRVTTRKINRFLRDFLSQVPSGGVVKLRRIDKQLKLSVPEILGVNRDGNREQLFDAVYIRRNYANQIFTSEREKAVLSTIPIERYEYASLGNVEITYEVEEG